MRKPMLKILTTLILTTIIVVPTVMAGAENISINISGNITASPCTIDTNTVSQTVDLGRSYAHNISVGSGSEWKAFQLTLSKCPAYWKNATVTFTGNAATDDDFFANSGSAKGVVLQISDSNHIMSYGNGDTMTQIVDESRNVIFPLEARMFNPGGGVSGGDFNAVVQVDFTYQ